MELHSRHHLVRNQQSSALVMVLALMTILTLILLAYINLMRTDRMATRNYAQGIRADEMERGAIDFIIGQLRAEMAGGAMQMTVGNYALYTNISSSNIAPSGVATNAAMLAVVAISTNSLGVYSGAAVPNVAVNSVSSTASANNRSINSRRWARPDLGTLPTSPSWFLVGAAGVTNTPSSLVRGRFAFAIYDLSSLMDINVAGYPSSLSATQRKMLRGSLAGVDLTQLPGLSQATIDALLHNFRNRTSATTATSYTNQALRVGPTNGFMHVSAGDDTFLSRQDLLAYAKLNGLTDAATNLTTFTRTVTTPAWSPSTNAGTVSNQVISRTTIVQWDPKTGASTTTTPTDYNYQANSAGSGSTNRNFLTQPVTTSFTRIDGTTSTVGEPLVLKRFPLSRLAWLSYTGPSAKAISQFGSASVAAAKIKSAFGLVWDSVNLLWVYTSPASANGGGSYSGSGSSDGPASTGKAAQGIKTLSVVATENREPDFFELLQAGILSGSLSERSDLASPVTMPQPGEITTQGHIFQIGANIIDQYDADDYPTLIRAYMPMVMEGRQHAYDFSETVPYVLGTGANALTPHDFAGVENLPYITDIRGRGYRPQVGDTTGYRTAGEAFLIPQFWNPHQNAAAVSGTRPTQLRFIQTFGLIYMSFFGNKMNSPYGTAYYDSNGNPWGFIYYETYPPSEWPSPSGRPQPAITFNGNVTFAQPGFLKQGDVVSTSIPEDMRPAIVADAHTVADLEPTGIVGLYLGRTPAAGTDHNATTPADALNDNTPVDSEVWANFTGGSSGNCPVQQGIVTLAIPCRANSLSLPPTDRFWKGDTSAANNNIRYPVFELQYLDGSVWKTYQRFDGFVRGGEADYKFDTVSRPPGYASSWVSESYNGLYARIDPRGSRFGLANSKDPNNAYFGTDWTGAAASYRNAPVDGIMGNRGRPSGAANPGGITGNQSGAQFTTDYDPSNQWLWGAYWQWLDNVVSGEHYTDNDLVTRRADGNSAASVDPLAASGTPYRPIMLNRAFTSVADLGYVFRDLPFKTLDFFSADSADGGLLDLFCINDTPVVSAGVVDLNGRSATVLASLLAGTVKDELGGGVLSSTEALAISQGLVKTTGSRPLNGLSDLPRFLADNNYTSAVSGSLSNVKAQMETMPRGLSGVADTRCWNLLIDVVTQAGIYPAGETNPDRFIVEGERRYWLSIALDRTTGKIVDEQLEPVWE